MGQRFEFGQNWQSFARLVDAERLRSAEDELARMLGTRDLRGHSFLDVGCGSGLHAVAAHRLGANEVVAIDLDPASVATARELLSRFGAANAATRIADVLNLPQDIGHFDIVYSWGVLHHTGDMRTAIRNAAACTRPGGLFAVALYGRTPFCGMWKRIKRWYVGATPRRRGLAEQLYVRLVALSLAVRGRRLTNHIADYSRNRGMEFQHDVRDWIGGYPYESIRPRELLALLEPLGFDLVASRVKRRVGLLGTGNDEFLFCRSRATTLR
jgi:2-polyprenyl-6-hydroxyphenyl methylase/3-demethylubiquinone-9 3-methyltransferase